MRSRTMCLILTIFAILGTVCSAWSEEKKEPAPKTIDAFQYHAVSKLFGPAYSLTIHKDGKVNYSYASEPHTGSGGERVVKQWKLSEKDHQAILKGLVEDGILDVEDTDKRTYPNYSITTVSVKEDRIVHPKAFPEKLLKRIKPLLQHAHPEAWGKEEK